MDEDTSDETIAEGRLSNPRNWLGWDTGDLLEMLSSQNYQINLAEVSRTLNGIWNISLHASPKKRKQVKGLMRTMADHFLDELLDEAVRSGFRIENQDQTTYVDVIDAEMREIQINNMKSENDLRDLEERRNRIKQRDFR